MAVNCFLAVVSLTLTIKSSLHLRPFSEAMTLKRAREKLGLTQQQAANKAGIQLRLYQRFESGERNLTNSPFNIGCNVLEVLVVDVAAFRQSENEEQGALNMNTILSSIKIILFLRICDFT